MHRKGYLIGEREDRITDPEPSESEGSGGNYESARANNNM
jgi:hypothetical protein